MNGLLRLRGAAPRLARVLLAAYCFSLLLVGTHHTCCVAASPASRSVSAHAAGHVAAEGTSDRAHSEWTQRAEAARNAGEHPCLACQWLQDTVGQPLQTLNPLRELLPSTGEVLCGVPSTRPGAPHRLEARGPPSLA